MHEYSMLENFLFPPVRLNKSKLKKELNGKTVLITGASYGIGESLSYLLADHNINLILVARTEEKLIEIKNIIEKKSAKVSIFSLDLRDNNRVDDFLDYIIKNENRVDFFINNAGKSIIRSINDSLNRYHDFTRTMAINYLAPVQILLKLIPGLVKNKGQIVNVSTINALLIPMPFWAAYKASKSAFDNWFRSASIELNIKGIRTSSIYLPLVKTRMIEPTKAYDKMPAMCPYHVAKIICKLMYTKKNVYKPWWIIIVQICSILLRRPVELVVKYYLKRKSKNN